jgi:septal ring factor EnvC (AmiA/AmiB activator)
VFKGEIVAELMILHHHHGRNYYDVSTPELKNRAYLHAFNFMDECQYYSDVEEHSELADWKQEIAELKPILESKKVPKSLHMDLKELERRIRELENQIEEAEENSSLFKRCKATDLEAIKEFMNYRSKNGYDDESIEFTETEEC